MCTSKLSRNTNAPMRIKNNGVMSNFSGTWSPLLTPDGKVTRDPKATAGYIDAVACWKAFQAVRPGLPFDYEIVTAIPNDDAGKDLFGHVVSGIRRLGDVQVGLFVLGGSPQNPAKSIETAAMYGEAFQLASKNEILSVSILPHGWREDMEGPKPQGKALAAIRKQVAETILEGLHRSGVKTPGFKLHLETLSGRNRRTRKGGPLELPILNQPNEVVPILEIINDTTQLPIAQTVVDFAHLNYGLVDWNLEGLKRLDILIFLIQEGYVSRLHLSVSELRCGAEPMGPDTLKRFVSHRLVQIEEGLRYIEKAGFEVPTTVAEIFLPAALEPLGLILPETGLRLENGPAEFVKLFRAVDPSN